MAPTKFRLSGPQRAVVGALADADRALRAGEIATAISAASPGSVAFTANALVRKGVLSTHEHGPTRRKTYTLAPGTRAGMLEMGAPS